jgi:hypothetical protein
LVSLSIRIFNPQRIFAVAYSIIWGQVEDFQCWFLFGWCLVDIDLSTSGSTSLRWDDVPALGLKFVIPAHAGIYLWVDGPQPSLG